MTRKTQVHVKLAGVLHNIATASAQMDDLAGDILAVLRKHKVSTLSKFESVAAAAYEANGWQKGGGRPKKGEEREPIPDAVKVYMSQIRKAYRLKLKVTTYNSMYDLRQAVTNKARKQRADDVEKEPQLTGVEVSTPDKFNGAALHDAIVFYMALDDDGKREFVTGLDRLMDRVRRKVTDGPMPKPKPGAQVPVSMTLH